MFFSPIGAQRLRGLSQLKSWGASISTAGEQPIPPSERGCEEDLPHILGAMEAKGGIKTNNRTFAITVLVDDVMSAMIDGFETAYDQETVRLLTYDSPTLTTPITISVCIKDYVYNLDKGEKVSITLTLVVSDVEWVGDITYVLNGGTNNVGNPATFTSADVPLTLLAPTKSGYTFVSWCSDADLTTAIATLDVLADITLYASWAV